MSLRELRCAADAKAALRGTLKAALRLGHNYIGTEHILLGILYAGGDTAQAPTGLGLDPATAERLLAAEFAALQARLTG